MEIIQRPWVSRNGQKQPKLAKIGWNHVKWDSVENFNPLNWYRYLHFYVFYSWVNIRKLLRPWVPKNSQKQPKLAKIGWYPEKYNFVENFNPLNWSRNLHFEVFLLCVTTVTAVITLCTPSPTPSQSPSPPSSCCARHHHHYGHHHRRSGRSCPSSGKKVGGTLGDWRMRTKCTVTFDLIGEFCEMCLLLHIPSPNLSI